MPRATNETQQDSLTEDESLDIQHLLHFDDMESPVKAHGISNERIIELRERIIEVTGVRLEDEHPELFPE